ncbi:MAG: hypothetical protein WB756_19045, partial [Xanthobacteraceae bacterium]
QPVCLGKRRDDHEPERCNSYWNKQGRHIVITDADGKRVQAEIPIELAVKLKAQIEAALPTARIRASRR